MSKQNVPSLGTGFRIEDKVGSGREYRNIQVKELRIAGDADAYIVEGYATTFNEPYELYSDAYYRILEQVDPGAFVGCDMSDVIVQYDHCGRVFARTRNNTLELRVDDHGLFCRIFLGGTETGRQLYEEIRNGYTDKMSFGFIVEEDRREEIENHASGTCTVLRTITKIKKLFDVSAVSIPANPGTTLASRNFCDGLIAELEAERRKTDRNKHITDTLKLLLEVTQ